MKGLDVRGLAVLQALSKLFSYGAVEHISEHISQAMGTVAWLPSGQAYCGLCTVFAYECNHLSCMPYRCQPDSVVTRQSGGLLVLLSSTGSIPTAVGSTGHGCLGLLSNTG